MSLRRAVLAALCSAFAILPAGCADGTGSAPNPTPGITGATPVGVLEGSGDFTLTINGSDFVRRSTVRWNGSDRPTTYVSVTQVTAAITAADVAQAGAVQVTVSNPAPGGGVSNPLTITVQQRQNPAPVVVSLSPASVVAGVGGTVTVTGTGFVASSAVRVGSTPVATTFVSGTELRFTLSPQQVPNAGTAAVWVINPAPGGGYSGSLALQVVNPAPAVTAVSPSQSSAGADSLVVRLSGSDFVAGTVVQFEGAARTTRLVSSTAVDAVLTAADLDEAGTYTLRAVTPAPGGGTSGTVTLTLSNPVPVLTMLPSQGATAGRPGFPLVVHGTGFVRTSVVRWNGGDRATNFISGTRLEISVSPQDVASPGSASITVHTPGAGTSGAASLTIRALGAASLTSTRTVALPAADIAWDRHSGRLYASMPASAGARANTVVAIDPATGEVTGSLSVGSEPGRLVISDDGSTLWVALNGTGEVRRVALPGLTAGTIFSLSGGSVGTYRVEEMRVMPGQAGTLAVALRNTCCSPRHEGVAIYDGGVRRAQTTPDHTGSNSIAFGESASVLYGYNNETTEFGFRTMAVTPSGVTVTRTLGGLVDRFYTRMNFASGRAYFTNGAVVDAARGARAGVFPAGGTWMALDPALGRAFYTDPSGALTVYDANTFQQLASVGLGELADDHPALVRGRMVRWGTDGLAVADGTQIRIVRTPVAGP